MRSNSDPIHTEALIASEKRRALQELDASHSDWPVDVRIVYQAVTRHLFDEGITAQAITASCGIYDNNVYCRFTEHVGYGIREFFIQHRLQCAKRLLQHDMLTIEQVAHAVGYGSPSGFSTTFKRRTGNTPSGFRQSGAQKDEKGSASC